MKTSLATLAFLALFATPPRAQEAPYFPDMALEQDWRDHAFTVNWYTKQLKGLEEPSLLALSKTQAHAYRFLWLRSFHNPVAVRINVRDDGTSLLTVKITNGKGGYDPGVLVRNETRNLTRKQTRLYLELVRKSDYWNLPPHETMNGIVIVDGAEWILEGVKDGHYKVVVRTSPDKGPVREIGLAILVSPTFAARSLFG
jgi:hypothetical protein